MKIVRLRHLCVVLFLAFVLLLTGYAPPAMAASPAPAKPQAPRHPNRPPQTAVLAAHSEVRLNVAYGSDPLQKLDIYAPKGASDAPVLIFIHGGEWARHDKNQVSYKPKFLNEHGIIFVSANYRLSPAAMHPAFVNDVAAAIGWVHGHIAAYGGSPDKIVIMGHSAGCHLVTLVSLDPRPLALVGLKPSDLAGVVPWSGGAYDLVEKVQQGGMYAGYIRQGFGPDEAVWRDASPVTHVTDFKPLPPFLFVSIEENKRSMAAALRLAGLIRDAGGRVETARINRNHFEANHLLGSPGDTTGQILLGFIGRVTQGRSGGGQARTSEQRSYRLPTVVVTASRTEAELKDIPQSVSVVTSQEIERVMPRTPNQALRKEPGVFSPETATQGSPIIRGQIGNRVLYLWDGIPLNNGALFSGPNAHLNQFPLGAIDRMEVLRGPGSVQYGSSAMGGVVNVISKKVDAFPSKVQVGGDVVVRMGTVDHEATEWGDFWLAGKSYNLIGGATFQNVGDTTGPDVGAMANTGFESGGGYLNLALRPLPQHTLRLSVIYNDRENIETYVQSKLNPSGIPRVFNPYEKRGLTKLDYQIDGLCSFSSELKAYVYSQTYTEMRERVSEKTTTLSNTARTRDQRVLGGGVQNTTPWNLWGKGKLVYGLDYRWEDLSSSQTLYTTTKATGVTVSSTPAGNVPDGTYDVFDLFAIMEMHPTEAWTLSLGGRYERTRLNSNPSASDVIPDAGYTIDDLEIDKIWDSLTWSVGAIYGLNRNLDLAANIATGFRAPTFSDALSTGTPIFSSKIASVPSPDVEPEKSITYEFGPRYHSERWSIQLTGYYMELFDVLTSVDSGTVEIPGQGTFIARHKDNSSRGYVKGLEFAAAFKPFPRWTVYGNATYTVGRDTTLDENYRFIPPLFGLIGVRYESPSKRWWFEADEVMVDKLWVHAPKDETDATFSTDPALGSPSDDNPPLHEDFTLPGYMVTNVRVGLLVCKSAAGRRFDITLAVNNLLNQPYREAYSQQELVAPGINVILSGKLTF